MDIKELSKFVVRIKRQEVYYFDKEGIYSKTLLETALEQDCFRNLHRNADGSYYWYSWQIDEILMSYFSDNELPNNRVLSRKVIASLKIGDTIEDYKENMKTVKLEKRPKPEGLDRFLVKISAPRYVREPENLNKNTFDYIYIDVCFVKAATEGEDVKKYIKRHFSLIKERVINKLKNAKSFTKYEVPINFLKITRVTIRNDDVIQIVFRLKDILKGAG